MLRSDLYVVAALAGATVVVIAANFTFLIACLLSSAASFALVFALLRYDTDGICRSSKATKENQIHGRPEKRVNWQVRGICPHILIHYYRNLGEPNIADNLTMSELI